MILQEQDSAFKIVARGVDKEDKGNRQEAPTSRSCAWSAIQLGMS
jgi:hypothetical protein